MLAVKNLTISVDGRSLFSPISIELKPQTITVIMGSSGVGKTSIINAIRGVMQYTGYIKSNNIFTVFQDSHQLFPWYSVKKNMEITCKNNWYDIASEWKLTDLIDKKPNSISGGQRQRFTLIRAICSGAETILCDEPLSGLDAMTSYNVLSDFKEKIIQLNLNVLYITHNIHEAKQIADEILLLSYNGLTKLPKDIDEKDFIKKLHH